MWVFSCFLPFCRKGVQGEGGKGDRVNPIPQKGSKHVRPGRRIWDLWIMRGHPRGPLGALGGPSGARGCPQTPKWSQNGSQKAQNPEKTPQKTPKSKVWQSRDAFYVSARKGPGKKSRAFPLLYIADSGRNLGIYI